jgi:hypothetical protein
MVGHRSVTTRRRRLRRASFGLRSFPRSQLSTKARYLVKGIYLSADRIVLPQDGAAVVQSIRQQFPGVKPGVVVLDTLK